MNSTRSTDKRTRQRAQALSTKNNFEQACEVQPDSSRNTIGTLKGLRLRASGTRLRQNRPWVILRVIEPLKRRGSDTLGSQRLIVLRRKSKCFDKRHLARGCGRSRPRMIPLHKQPKKGQTTEAETTSIQHMAAAGSRPWVILRVNIPVKGDRQRNQLTLGCISRVNVVETALGHPAQRTPGHRVTGVSLQTKGVVKHTLATLPSARQVIVLPERLYKQRSHRAHLGHPAQRTPGRRVTEDGYQCRQMYMQAQLRPQSRDRRTATASP